MAEIKNLLAVVSIIFILTGTLNAEVVGDVNKDSKIELDDAIYALQITAGIRQSVDIMAGKHCWLVHSMTQDFRPDFVKEFIITPVSEGYYQVQSKMVLGGNYEAVFGILQAYDNQYVMSVTAIHSDSQPPTNDADCNQCQYFLDKTTLNGSGWCLTTFFNPNDNTSGLDYHIISLTIADCP